MAGLKEFYCGSNEPSHASQFKWLEYTFKKKMIDFANHCWPARLRRLAGRYDNPMPVLTVSPSQGLRIWPLATSVCLVNLLCWCL